MRNDQAALSLKAMKVGDLAFYYHSQLGLEVVGVAEVLKEAFPDASDAAGRFVAVEVKPVRKLTSPVSLAAMKADPRLAGMAMFRQFRLSVAPVTDAEWAVSWSGRATGGSEGPWRVDAHIDLVAQRATRWAVKAPGGFLRGLLPSGGSRLIALARDWVDVGIDPPW